MPAMLVDATGTIQALNTHAVTLFQRRYPAIANGSVSFSDALANCFLSEDRQALEAARRSSSDCGLPARHKALLITRSGEAVILDCVFSPVSDEPGELTLATFFDISNEHAIARQITRKSALAEDHPSPIGEFDARSHMLYANRALLTLIAKYGYDHHAQLPRALPPKFSKLIQDALVHPVLFKTECAVNDAVYEWTLAPLPEEGIVRLYGQDLTALREEHAKLQRALDEAQQAERAKSRFLATMSHELRTPMNGVLGMAQVLQCTPLDDEQQDCVKTILESGEHLLGVLNDILDFSKLEHGKIELEQIAFEPRQEVKAITDILSVTARGKGIALTATIDPRVPQAVIGDPQRFRQLMLNLAGNAIKFTHKGEVSVSLDIDQDAEPCPERHALRLVVRDTGVGIPPEARERIFSPFSQADASTTRKYGGTGLGLSICKQIAELMGGSIAVESEAGKGSVFCVKLPFAHASDASQYAGRNGHGHHGQRVA